MNMNSNIKRGTSINSSVVLLTDIPTDVLIDLRDAVDNAISKAQNEDCDRLLTDIIAAIDAVRDEGYEVWYNGEPIILDLLGVGTDDDEDDY